MAFVHRHRVRYVECDMQGVMHNSQYLAVVDDAVDLWVAPISHASVVAGWDFMVKRAEIVWTAPARLRDELVTTLDVVRWGTTSFDVCGVGRIGEQSCFTATITYVGVDRAQHRPMPVPPFAREHLG